MRSQMSSNHMRSLQGFEREALMLPDSDDIRADIAFDDTSVHIIVRVITIQSGNRLYMWRLLPDSHYKALQ